MSGLCLTALGFLLPRHQDSSPSPRGGLVCSELVAAAPGTRAGKQAGAGTGPPKVHGGADEEARRIKSACAMQMCVAVPLQPLCSGGEVTSSCCCQLD